MYGVSNPTAGHWAQMSPPTGWSRFEMLSSAATIEMLRLLHTARLFTCRETSLFCKSLSMKMSTLCRMSLAGLIVNLMMNRSLLYPQWQQRKWGQLQQPLLLRSTQRVAVRMVPAAAAAAAAVVSLRQQ
jgi:hypothetical protein